jgi:prepilin-type N-terminal cleavage/methylation domain-containing protein
MRREPGRHSQLQLRHPDGFTLIEVMVALAILAALSVLTAQSMQTAIANRSKAKAQVARDSSIRDALSVISADVGAAFHHRDIQTAMLNEITNPTPTPGPGGIPPGQQQPPQFSAPQGNPNGSTSAGATPRPTPVNLTGFIGDSESMYFTVLNNVRTLRDAPESDQAKIGYFVKSCKSRTSPGKPSKCLYRAHSPVLDDDVSKPGPAAMLIDNVETFKLRYLGPGHEEPVEQWKTGAQGRDAAAADNFPYAVEITLTIHDRNDPKEKPLTATILAPIRFPNNAEKKDEKANPNGGGTGTGGGNTGPNSTSGTGGGNNGGFGGFGGSGG